jgi:hypothetical protein
MHSERGWDAIAATGAQTSSRITFGGARLAPVFFVTDTDADDDDDDAADDDGDGDEEDDDASAPGPNASSEIVGRLAAMKAGRSWAYT